jgi:hypothetical protein
MSATNIRGDPDGRPVQVGLESALILASRPCHNPAMLSTIWQDMTFALRQLWRSPGFAVSAIVTLAFGIGATTAIFTLVDGILLRPLPFPDHDGLIAIDTVEFPPGVPDTNPEGG